MGSVQNRLELLRGKRLAENRFRLASRHPRKRVDAPRRQKVLEGRPEQDQRVIPSFGGGRRYPDAFERRGSCSRRLSGYSPSLVSGNSPVVSSRVRR